jgi:hypothetical protein
METGKYDNISLNDYHKLPGWSKTALDHINRSPAHFMQWRDEPKEQTPAMLFGSAFHCAVLTPKLYGKYYITAPQIDKRSKEGKEKYAQFEKKAEGKTIITEENNTTIREMQKAIFSHPLASNLLSNGEAEQSFFWTDKRTGLKCKARPDYLRYDAICIDVKTTDNASIKSFQRSMYNYRYYVQGAFFLDGIFQSTNINCDNFVIIAIEKEKPYGIMIYCLDDLAIDTGRIEYEKNLDTCLDFENDPEKYKTVYPVSTDPVELSLPPWAD